jgi:hypothetical protein
LRSVILHRSCTVAHFTGLLKSCATPDVLSCRRAANSGQGSITRLSVCSIPKKKHTSHKGRSFSDILGFVGTNISFSLLRYYISHLEWQLEKVADSIYCNDYYQATCSGYTEQTSAGTPTSSPNESCLFDEAEHMGNLSTMFSMKSSNMKGPFGHRFLGLQSNTCTKDVSKITAPDNAGLRSNKT